MKYILFILIITTAPVFANLTEQVTSKIWVHGAEDCSTNKEPAIDILEVDKDTFILRQNKCLNYEAPFIYLLFGEDTLFIQDTGATEDADKFPLYETIENIINQRAKNLSTETSEINILVSHSHGHGDHRAADEQFRGKPQVTVIETDVKAISTYFNLNEWPDGESEYDLGNRKLTIFPIPGHHDQSIAVFDHQTGWLLTGDTFYPGRLYVKDWILFKSSIQKLVSFSEKHHVTALMGTHIEMSTTPGSDYPMGSNYQPDETSLVLSVSDLILLSETLSKMQDAEHKVFDKYIISPVGTMQKVIGGIVGWFTN